MTPLLFDQNTSWRVVRLLASEYPGSVHVSTVGLAGATDIDIYRYDARKGYCIVAFDRDFYHLSLSRDEGVRIVWLRTGNLPTERLARLLIERRPAIRSFLEAEQARCLQIFADRDTDPLPIN